MNDYLPVFTAVVVENFGSVSNKQARIGREEMRRFKKVWSDFDISRSGFIRRSDYVPFFAVGLANLCYLVSLKAFSIAPRWYFCR